VALACVKIELNILWKYSLKELSDELLVDVLAWDVESNGVDTFVKDVESLLISFFRACHVDVLSHIPDVVILLVAPHKWKLARKRVYCLEVGEVLTTIERLHIEAFVSSL